MYKMSRSASAACQTAVGHVVRRMSMPTTTTAAAQRSAVGHLMRRLSVSTTAAAAQQSAVGHVVRRMSMSAAAPHLADQSAGAKPFNDMPAPPRLPFLGHGHLFVKNQNRFHKFFDELRQEYGDVVRLSLSGLGETVIIFKPEDVQQMYSNDGAMPILPGFDPLARMRREEAPEYFPGTTGLISQGEEWYQFRHAVQQDMMRVSSAMYYIPDIEEVTQELGDKIARVRSADGIVADPLPLLHEFALESIGCIFLESRLGALKGDPDGKKIIEQTLIIFTNTLPILFYPYWLARHTPGFKKTATAIKDLCAICHKRVHQAATSMDNNSLELNNKSGVLAKMIRKCGKDSNIPVIMAVDALTAGIDTTGNTGAILLYHLASNPDKQEKLYQELTEVLGPNGQITEAKLAKLKYLKACQKESQRMLPVVSGTARTTQVDMILGGYHVPAGVTVMRAGQVTSNMAENFTEPHKFLPERWLRGCPERHQASSFANLPFGHGPRSCIGQRFAQLELQILAAKLVQRFRMEYNGPPVDVITTFVSRPDRDISIRFIDR